MIDPKTIDKNAIIETETDKIYHLLDDKYNENFDFIERDENSIRLTFEFKGYDYENIEIKPIIINDYGVLKYDITIETYSSDNEVETPEAIMQHENYTTPPTEKKLNQIDKKAENELTIWNNSKSIILRGNSHRLITVEIKCVQGIVIPK